MPCTVLHIPAAVVHDARDKQVTYCAEDLKFMHILPACLLAGSFEHMGTNAIGEASKQKLPIS
jgi:hypothetical protein